MLAARLLAALLATLALTSGVQASPAASAAPQGLHAFLFRADEAVRHEFARTPSFAWNPVRGATGYEFELATSNTFRENGLVYVNRELKTPVASVTLTLPWITGSPYSLYARARTVFRNGFSRWSTPFGFNLRQPDVPKPLPSYPGLLRWTPIEGAGGYQVWLVDIGKFVPVYSNVLDEREVYTFHQSPAWTSKVRWRIRTLRWDVHEDGQDRKNGLPVTSYGPWSPVYESTNPAFETGPLRLVGTVSDIVAKGRSRDDAHRLMPAFVFAGNQALDGTTAELFRVYVFTDRDCLNRVWASSIVGSPANAPRPYGPLALPKDAGSLASMRGGYLRDGEEGTTYAGDGEQIVATESLPQATPTTTLPAADEAPADDSSGSGGSGGDKDDPGSGDSGSGSGSSAEGGGVKFINVDGGVKFGAPVDLWDTNWPEGGYYWTVVPVGTTPLAATATTVADPGAAAGSTTLPVASAAGFAQGDVIQVGSAANVEAVTVTSVAGNVLNLGVGLKQAHGVGEPVVRSSGGGVEYRDLELPQEVCASGRVMRFGKSSEPTLVSAGAPFASGLSPRGRLTSAVAGRSSFYGAPLVAWTPALGAIAYHVQWSKTREPFRPENVNWRDKGAAAGFLTLATSAVLPLQPGTWWYRVRGVNYSLPTNAQHMAWSDAARLVVAKPTFKVGGP